SDEKDNLLVRLLSQGRGSLDFARNLLEDVREPDPDPDPDPPQNNPTGTGGIAWCKCSVCEVMPTTEENVCCKLVTCVTSYQRFHNICIDREVLELAIRVRCDIRADEPDYSMTSYRIAAYRQYVLWKYGKLGRGNRRVLPSCVVRTIRNSYRAAGEAFMGYRRS
ncbi:P2X purinoceptor 7, partial [Exaiptasia diaphana]